MCCEDVSIAAIDRVIELWKWVGIIGLIVLNHRSICGQQVGFLR